MARFECEEHRLFPQWLGWLVLLTLPVLIIGYGLLCFILVPDVPRQWTYRALPAAPGQSIYSTVSPPLVWHDPGRQMLALPEGQRWKRDLGYDPNALPSRDKVFAKDYRPPRASVSEATRLPDARVRPLDAGAGAGPPDTKEAQ